LAPEVLDLTKVVAQCLLVADCVAKLFSAPERATLIQGRAPMRNVDPKFCAPGFDYCEPTACRRVLQQNRPFAAVHRSAAISAESEA
jgi:hypothetical protein